MMNSPVSRMFGIEFPLLAFTHCRDVVVAVSKAGGMGVFGAVGLTPERFEEELAWIDAHIDGKPYGVDFIVPNAVDGKGEHFSPEALLHRLPGEHKAFADHLLAQHGIDPSGLDELRHHHTRFAANVRGTETDSMLEVAFRHPIKLIANALGVPPPIMLEEARRHGVAVAALIGSKEHAIAQVHAGVDILVAAGGEAGGHCGDVSTMVLVPEVCRTLAQAGVDTPVLAAGGIATGAQMAAAMAMGAAGAWCGSVWLTTAEAETNPVVKEKMLAASSRDTVRSRSRTGKPSRQLRSPWTDAWERDGAPKPLPMPLQTLISEPALEKVDKLSQSGHEGAKTLATYWVGQAVGLMNQSMSAAQVVQEFKEDFLRAFERLAGTMGS